MIDPGTLAAAAVAALSPYLVEGGKEAAKAAGKETAAGALRLLDWLKGKLTGAGAEVLAEVEKAPQDADAQGALRLQIRKLLEREPALAGELERLLAGLPEPAKQQVLSQIGNDNHLAAVIGTGNTMNVS